MTDRDEHFNSRIHITGLQVPPSCSVSSDERKCVYVTLTFDKGKVNGERVDVVVSGDVDQMKRFAMGLMRVRDVVLLECERVYGQMEEMEEADVERAREDEADQWRMNR
jgi:hypothetical protein